MVASALQSQPQPPSAEEEALRRNTDCVYFLASPLTCKKGSECEYRHSDVARLNPRDCWFWLNGNCLNPKCGFRHPPLDGLMGTQTPASSGPSAHVPSNPTAPASHTANTSTKQQGVACIFFQKGFCLKGDWCPFLHGPNSLGNKASLATGVASAADPAAPTKKGYNGIENSLQEKKALPKNVAKSVKDAHQVKPLTEVEPAPPQGNEFAMNRKVPQTFSKADFPGYRTTPLVSNGNPVSWPSQVQPSHLLEEPESMYVKDTEEVSREPSPGFDVLVDDEGRDSEYYPGEDGYRMSMERDARKVYDMDHSSDYNMIAAVDNERYGGSLGYDSHDIHTDGQYTWEHRRASSERISGGSYFERRPYDRPDSHGRVNESDLRHHLAKHRNSNGLRSVISREHDMQVGDQSYQSLRKDEQRIPLHSSRLRGRIRLPQQSSSPVRTGISSHQGRIRNRIKGSVEEAFNNSGKNHRGSHSRRDTAGNDITDFAGPKSLAELKNRKNGEPIKQQVTDQQSLGKRKHLMLDGNQQSGSDLSFEGPKPLEEILKRKRSETIGSIHAGNSSNNQGVTGDDNHEGKDSAKNEVQKSMPTDAEEIWQAAKNSPNQPITSKFKPEDIVRTENQLDQETEGQHHGDGMYDYDQAGGEDYDLYDGENGDGEYLDEEEDEDEFAKKMGVMYS